MIDILLEAIVGIIGAIVSVFIPNLEFSEERFTRIYDYKEFNSTKACFEQNSNITGTKDVFDQVVSANREYNDEMEKSREGNRGKYSKLRSLYWIVWIIRLIVMAVVIATFIGGFFNSAVWTIMRFGIMVLIVACIVYFIVYKIMESFFFSYEYTNRRIQDRFDSVCRKGYQMIDELYLNSLDPVHRELVLLRRENARNAQLQDQRNASLQRELKNSREISKELLDIERRKEQRFGGY